MITIDQIKPNRPVTCIHCPGHIPMRAGYILDPIPDKPLNGRPLRLTGNIRSTEIREVNSYGDTDQFIQVECRGVCDGEGATFWVDLKNIGLLS